MYLYLWVLTRVSTLVIDKAGDNIWHQLRSLALMTLFEAGINLKIHTQDPNRICRMIEISFLAFFSLFRTFLQFFTKTNEERNDTYLKKSESLQTEGRHFRSKICLILHSSEKRRLSSTFCSGKTLQNLPYL